MAGLEAFYRRARRHFAESDEPGLDDLIAEGERRNRMGRDRPAKACEAA
jgi:hypothetical protein